MTRTLAIALTAAFVTVTSVQTFTAVLPWLQAYTSAAWAVHARIDAPGTAWVVACRERWEQVSR